MIATDSLNAQGLDGQRQGALMPGSYAGRFLETASGEPRDSHEGDRCKLHRGPLPGSLCFILAVVSLYQLPLGVLLVKVSFLLLVYVGRGL